jgi:3-hydroxyisobutyrate dehydrogenase-like beta-hydroxyacid dehydrogenase
MNIGFIGLGKMGTAIAGHLLASGHRVRVWNRSPEAARELVAKGAAAVARPTDVVPADFLLTMLANDAVVRSVIFDQGVLEAAPAGLLQLIAMGGGKQDWSALAQVAAQRAGLDRR